MTLTRSVLPSALHPVLMEPRALVAARAVMKALQALGTALDRSDPKPATALMVHAWKTASPTFNDCTTCNIPRAMLNGRCEFMVAQSGVCDSSLTTLDGTFVRSMEKGICDSCPVGCKKCHMPEWNTGKPWSDIACTECQDGYILQDHTCVKECPTGSFWVSANGTSAPSVDQCLTCPPDRPVLSGGRCIPFCPPGTVLDQGNCRPCSGNCTSCLPSGCTACADDFVLSGGVCSPAACEGPFAPSLGVCLSTLVQATTSNRPKPRSTNLVWLAGACTGLALVVLGVAWFIHRERRRTREATTEFARQMDDQSVHKRLARLFGYDAPPPRLRELRLRPRAARPHIPPVHKVQEVPVAPRTPPSKTAGVGKQWVTPPPSYAPRTRPTSPDLVNIPLEPRSLRPPPRAFPGPIDIADPNATAQAGLTGAVPLSPNAIRELGELWSHRGRRYSHSIV
ncbi:hypothetical protein CspeluHIS016_0406980 [Cutaneotrichosporon spelunceum]|uniref:Growth factor receptor domain-containing protein n=1 Tax=Cutaneotrichosporon spelunceum TaxID=1672016 RepID=A0AAD3YDF8_9TREE|nr:hypothetical protein CspeluHIS016_0406980 [Cutaneotrichosporon spelunceum]